MKLSIEGKKIVFGGDKGGTGKSTGAVSLASSLAQRGYTVALLDADTKIGSANWVSSRLQLIDDLKNNLDVFSEKLPSGKEQLSKTIVNKLVGTTFNPITIETTTGNIHRTIVSLSQEHDFVIVDTAGGIKSELTSALTVADLFISPFKASAFDLQTVEELSELIDRMLMVNPKLKTFCYLNEVPTNVGHDNIKISKNFIGAFEHIHVANTVINSYESHRKSVSFGASVMEWTDAKAKGQISMLTEEILKILEA
jgi:chromosome partitioning protein